MRLRHNWFELEQNHLKPEHNSARLRHNTSELQQNSDAPVANRSLSPNCSCNETLHDRVPCARKAKEVARGAQASWIHIVSSDSFNFTCSCPCEVIHNHRVRIKGWVQPDGDMLVNELFTYSLDGSFSQLTRSFPEKHRDQVHLFEAYRGRTGAGGREIEESTLTKAEVTREGSTYVTTIPADQKSVSVLYVYTLHKAVTSYDSYSDLSVTYFESGDNHDEDLNNVDISYVLPGDVGDNHVHGFMHDREGRVRMVYRDGIMFHTPKSAAYTVTETRVLFPSTIMTGQQKFSAPVSLEEAILKEQERIR